MRKFVILLVSLFSICTLQAEGVLPLSVSDNGRYLQTSDSKPFFWLANTAWLMPQKLTREEVDLYLDRLFDTGYNVALIQVLNDVPSRNVYGDLSHPDGWNLTIAGSSGYWRHLDYIIDSAERRGIYIGMVCIWGGLVKKGLMDTVQAQEYGGFLAERYRDKPNIIWIAGGDIRGDIRSDVWESLAVSIKQNDPNHLVTFHPFGRTSSAYWWHEATWLDFNLFQSGHRCYDQIRGDGDDMALASVAEDNWRYVADAYSREPAKPVIDGEPSYEDIPYGLHDLSLPRWKACDVRRYAYWSVFAGAAGHTYGHNSVMQFFSPGDEPVYGATMHWRDAVFSEGFAELQHLKNLIESLPFTERFPAQDVLCFPEGERYERATAIRGKGYILVYTYTNQPLSVNIGSINAEKVKMWWMNPRDGSLQYIGETGCDIVSLQHPGKVGPGNDWIFIAKDSSL